MQRLLPATLAALVLLPPAHTALLAAEPLVVTARPSGPSARSLRTLALILGQTQPPGGNGRWTLLSLQVEPGAQDRYLATMFDYQANQAWNVEGAIATPITGRRVWRVPGQPPASVAEFGEALKAVTRSSPEIAEELRKGTLLPFRPMPPLLESADGNRTVNVGLMPTTERGPAQIVGVDLVSGTVVPYAAGVPENSAGIATDVNCGPANANQTPTVRGTAGQADITITRGTTTLWQFTVIRPSVSSGNLGSAIEFVNVRYKGKLVLARAHNPIMNVKYTGDVCGPYRDWQWEENPFTANGTDVAPGIRQATSMPTTIADTGNDTGNFSGVAYYVGASSVVFMSELQAGWYRYTPKWTFDDNGTIHARIGYFAVSNGCVCNIHLHNGWFRFDFDIDGAGSTTVSRRTQAGWQPVTTEAWGRNDRIGGGGWQARNAGTGDAYQVNPGPYDYVADEWGVGDWWILKSKGTSEIDDGVTCTSCGGTAPIGITSFVNGESTANTKVVLWYGAHYLHYVSDGAGFGVSQVIGPDLVPVHW